MDACKYRQTEYGCDGRRNGISNMLTHIKVQCKKIPYRLANTSQQNLTFKLTKNGNELVSLSFNLEVCRKALTKMIIVDELPFRFVEGLKNKVLETLSELFEFYKSLYSTSDCTLQNQNIILLRQETGAEALEDRDEDVSNLISRFRKHMEENDDLGSKSELDMYLLEGTVRDEGKFDILEWWKSNTTRYRVLSCVARDALVVLVYSVASKSAFSTAGRILDPFRSCLAPNAVEALICAQDWLRSSSVPINLRESMDEVEQFDRVVWVYISRNLNPRRLSC